MLSQRKHFSDNTVTMKIRFYCLLLFFVVSIPSALLITVKCAYHDKGDWWVIENFYYCNAENHLNIDSPDRSTIESITGNHFSGKTFDDVEGFEADNLTISYFPKGLDKIFKNLKMIDINNGRLKEIHQSDLKPFPKLTCLELYDNDIEVLENGLFDYNPNLEMIWLTDNKIIHIDVDLFDKLVKLTYLSLDTNRCISEHADDNKTAVAEVIRHAKNKCQDMLYLRAVYPVFMNEFDNMKDELMELQNEHHHTAWIGVVYLLFCGSILISIGFFVYKTFLKNNHKENARVSFENHDYS